MISLKTPPPVEVTGCGAAGSERQRAFSEGYGRLTSSTAISTSELITISFHLTASETPFPAADRWPGIARRSPTIRPTTPTTKARNSKPRRRTASCRRQSTWGSFVASRRAGMRPKSEAATPRLTSLRAPAAQFPANSQMWNRKTPPCALGRPGRLRGRR